MEDLHITGAVHMSGNKVMIQLSDERALIFSLEQLLTLTPDDVTTEEDVEEEEA